MTLNDGFDRTVSTWLAEQVGHGTPDYLDEILVATARTQQRPRWSSLERWLPVQTTLRLAPVPRVAWLLVVLALVVALSAAVLVVGSRRHQPAPPFGLARNGAIVYGGTDGDIHRLDPVTGATTALIGGPSKDHDPLVSPDGTRLLFLRDTTIADPTLDGMEPMIMLANADGGEIRALTGALANFDSNVWSRGAAWSSDGSHVAVASDVDEVPVLRIYTVDGSAEPINVDIEGRTATYVSFRPGDREVTFLGRDSGVGLTAVGLYAVTADGRTLRTIVRQADGEFASLSPDGSTLAYAGPGGGWAAYSVIHVIDVDTGLDRIPAFDPPIRAALADTEPTWSPDGTMLLFQRYDVTTYRMAVAPAAGGSVVEIGPKQPWQTGAPVGAQFSPDGLQILAHYDDDGSTWMLDPSGSTPDRLLPSSIASTASWQRQAP